MCLLAISAVGNTVSGVFLVDVNSLLSCLNLFRAWLGIGLDHCLILARPSGADPRASGTALLFPSPATLPRISMRHIPACPQPHPPPGKAQVKAPLPISKAEEPLAKS